MTTFISFVDDIEHSPIQPAVIVVDDEPCIVDLLTEILNDRYRCLSACRPAKLSLFLRQTMWRLF